MEVRSELPAGDVFDLIRTNEIHKSQFETESEHRTRIARLHPGRRLYQVTLKHEFRYDAEAGEMSVYRRSRAGTIYGYPTSQDAMQIADGFLSESPQINILNYKQLPKDVTFAASSFAPAVGLRFKLPSAEAKALVERMALNVQFEVGDLGLAKKAEIGREIELPIILRSVSVVNTQTRIVVAHLATKPPSEWQ